MREIVDRSDVDKHSNIDKDDLGEDWGDGFYVQEEFVLVERGPEGEIVRTTPLSEVTTLDPGAPPEEAAPARPIRSVPVSEREKLVDILATRLFKWYESLGPSPKELNPIYDGIPTCHEHPTGCWLDCKRKGPKYLASRGEVYEWMKRVIAARVQLINKKQGAVGWQTDAADVSLRINRKPVVR
jgi:hypothetical protein